MTSSEQRDTKIWKINRAVFSNYVVFDMCLMGVTACNLERFPDSATIAVIVIGNFIAYTCDFRFISSMYRAAFIGFASREYKQWKDERIVRSVYNSCPSRIF